MPEEQPKPSEFDVQESESMPAVTSDSTESHVEVANDTPSDQCAVSDSSGVDAVVDDPWSGGTDDPPESSTSSAPLPADLQSFDQKFPRISEPSVKRKPQPSDRAPAKGRDRPSPKPSVNRSPQSASGWETTTKAAAAWVVALMEQFRPRIQAWREKVQPQLTQVQNRWAIALHKIRALLPTEWTAKLSDQALGGIVAGVLLLLLFILFNSGGKTQPRVAQAPEATPSPPTVVIPETPPALPDLSRITETFPSLPEAVPMGPPPPLELSPEQSLIAAIQDQVAEITNQYRNGLIQATQANFRSSLLTIQMGNEWYDLTPSRQDQLADDLLQRSRDLDFSKLEMTDIENRLLARSPYVGATMVILKRALD